LPDGGHPIFVVEIASSASHSRCGRPGDRVMLTIDGRALDETIEWRPGFQQPVSLRAGPDFLQVSGRIVRADTGSTVQRVVPYIDGRVCGEDVFGLAMTGNILPYQVVIDPEALQPHCGRDGMEVTLVVEFASGARVVLHRTTWQAGGRIDLGETTKAEILSLPAASP
jgi:hypothetical protein